MRSLAGSIAYSMLADAILIPPQSPLLPTNIRKGRGRQKSTETSKRKTIHVRMAKCFSKKYGNKG